VRGRSILRLKKLRRTVDARRVAIVGRVESNWRKRERYENVVETSGPRRLLTAGQLASNGV
jgi:hypothetical protein